jgi:predicted negative regulator of RcsB-dependent stress response
MHSNAHKGVLGIIAGIAFIIAAGFLYIWYVQRGVNQHPINQKVPVRDFYTETAQGTFSADLTAAKNLILAGNVDEGIAKLQQIKTNITDPGQKSVVDLSVADATYHQKNKYQGAQLYAAVKNNETYPNVSRAYAELYIVDQYSASGDKELFKSFFSADEYSASTGHELLEKAHKAVYDLYPFGYAASGLASDYLSRIVTGSRTSISDQDFVLVSQYIDATDRDLANLDNFQGMKVFIPATLQTEAKVFRILEKVGRPIPRPVETVYTEAIARSRTLNNQSAEEFSMFGLADYLAEKTGNEEKIISILNELAATKLVALVKERLGSVDQVKQRTPSLYALVNKDSKVKAAYTAVLKNNEITPK